MTPADTALALLRESRDGGLLWHDNGAMVVRGDRGGLLQREVTRREAAIRAWWQVTGEAHKEVRG